LNPSFLSAASGSSVAADGLGNILDAVIGKFEDQLARGHVVRFAEAGRASRDNLQHGLEFGRRSADYLKNLRSGRLLFLRVVQFAGEPRDLGFPAGS
jgi:hypothetical protein